MPPLWLISTASPATFLTLQVPHRPNSQAAGIRTPEAACRLQHGLAGDAFGIDIGKREPDRCRGFDGQQQAPSSAGGENGAGILLHGRRAKLS
jgi:hypothetical protein